MRESKKSGKASKIIYILLLVVFATVFLVSGGMLLKYFLESQQSQQTYNGLKDIKGDFTRPTISREEADPTAETTEPAPKFVTVTDPGTGLSIEVLPQFAELYTINPDIVGWITFPGTNVDYPVVQRPENTDYYLYRDFYGKHDSRGCIYAREVCDIFRPSDNITIYGHRMRDNTMFADLAKLQDKAYWEQNQLIYFDTLQEYHTYQIIYVLTTTASVGEGFSYHQFVDAGSAGEFDNFIASCERYQLFDTGVTATYGDKLITLSTCEYTHENGRLVIVAKRID